MMIRVVHFLSKKPAVGENAYPWNSNVWLSSRLVDGVESKHSVRLASIPVTWAMAPLNNGPNGVARIIHGIVSDSVLSGP